MHGETVGSAMPLEEQMGIPFDVCVDGCKCADALAHWFHSRTLAVAEWTKMSPTAIIDGHVMRMNSVSILSPIIMGVERWEQVG